MPQGLLRRMRFLFFCFSFLEVLKKHRPLPVFSQSYPELLLTDPCPGALARPTRFPFFLQTRRYIEPEFCPEFYLAYLADPSDSGKAHNDVRNRFDAGDAEVILTRA